MGPALLYFYLRLVMINTSVPNALKEIDVLETDSIV